MALVDQEPDKRLRVGTTVGPLDDFARDAVPSVHADETERDFRGLCRGKGCLTPVILVVAEEESVVHEDAQVVFSLSANVRFRAQVVRASHRQAESFLL